MLKSKDERFIMGQPSLIMAQLGSKVSWYETKSVLKTHSLFWRNIEISSDVAKFREILLELVSNPDDFLSIKKVLIPLYAPKVIIITEAGKQVQFTDLKMRKGVFGASSISFKFDDVVHYECDDGPHSKEDLDKYKVIIERCLADISAAASSETGWLCLSKSDIDALSFEDLPEGNYNYSGENEEGVESLSLFGSSITENNEGDADEIEKD